MKFNLDIAYQSLNKHHEELCGDRIEILKTEEFTIVILTDGMGSGVKANILGTLTAKILGTMLQRGSTISECVETVAKTLPVCKTRGMAYSTFSILQVYDSGEAYLVEFDNPSCIFIREGLLTEIPFHEMVVGDKRIKECRFYVKENDLFVLTSDGVSHAGVGHESNFGWQWSEVADFVLRVNKERENGKYIAAEICRHCQQLYHGLPEDDTTVLVTRIIPKQRVKLLTGPPENMEQDERAVAQLLEGDGITVVCGGTTANIVSRVLQKPLMVDLHYVDVNIPPMAVMEGIDLVTEGIFTLNKTVELLRMYQQAEDPAEFFIQLDRNDGAARLTRILLEQCTDLKIIVGKAINPVYQNPQIPLVFNIRVNLIQQLKEICEQLGKMVILSYID